MLCCHFPGLGCQGCTSTIAGVNRAVSIIRNASTDPDWELIAISPPSFRCPAQAWRIRGRNLASNSELTPSLQRPLLACLFHPRSRVQPLPAFWARHRRARCRASGVPPPLSLPVVIELCATMAVSPSSFLLTPQFAVLLPYWSSGLTMHGMRP